MSVAAREQHREMRVCLATTSTSVGGVWHHMVHLARGLREQGHDVHVALGAGAAGPLAQARELRLEARPLWKSIDRRVDVWHVHLHDSYDRAAAGLLAARHALGAAVVTEHLPHFNGSDRTLLAEGPRSALTAPVKTALKRVSIATCDAVIVPSARVSDFFRSRYRLGDTDKLHAIPLGVPPQPAAGPIPEGAIGEVLASGSMIVQKGFDLLCQAARLAEQPWPLTILGDGPHRASIERAFAGLLGARATLPGWQDEPLAWLERARVVCLPSRWETFPLAAIEAQLAARPVVAFAVDGIPEIVVHDATGLLVEPGDLAGLARALDRLSSDRDLAIRMGQAGRERALELFGLDRMIRSTEAVYEAARER